MKSRTYYIKTFGCQQNVADSERIAKAFESRGFRPAKAIDTANYVVINTCMVRQSAENRVYGLVNNLAKLKRQKQKNNEFFKIIVTGCMVGLAFRDKTGKYLQRLKSIMPSVDEFMPIEEVGFDNEPLRQDNKKAWVPISNGCNNFCTFCVVPFTRGREISRPFNDIINECINLKNKGYEEIVLLGQNVNSYGADLIMGQENIQVMRDFGKNYFDTDSSYVGSFSFNGKKIKPVYVKHLGRLRIPTLFPFLLEEVAKLGFKKVDFISSNPWDFSDELIDVISRNENITRVIHLPLQSGDDEVLKRMNRWYTSKDYLNLINKIRKKVPSVEFTTDIIVGFCGETDKQFENTVKLAKMVGFSKAYIAMYSQRPFTAAVKVMEDNVPFEEKKRRWLILDKLINHRYRDDQEN
ncbi:MAG: tRNA-2-methylthio-N(6)-dimethylallyladenosine synthase [Patescibacteria group bacterium]|nr:MAG: tRNA-2-methylthio-N(6)-dimethylallyladenosine synthase [Patescibacteria group bacterium]